MEQRGMGASHRLGTCTMFGECNKMPRAQWIKGLARTRRMKYTSPPPPTHGEADGLTSLGALIPVPLLQRPQDTGPSSVGKPSAGLVGGPDTDTES